MRDNLCGCSLNLKIKRMESKFKCCEICKGASIEYQTNFANPAQELDTHKGTKSRLNLIDVVPKMLALTCLKFKAFSCF